jgi:hypothetical protein
LQRIEEEGMLIAAAVGINIVDAGSSNADLCSWKEAPFPKHLNNEAKQKYMREEAEKKLAALK